MYQYYYSFQIDKPMMINPGDFFTPKRKKLFILQYLLKLQAKFKIADTCLTNIILIQF